MTVISSIQAAQWGPGQPSREAHQPFILFSWTKPLLVINDSVRGEWCFWFDPQKRPTVFFISREEG